jgi:hypothetical protein
VVNRGLLKLRGHTCSGIKTSLTDTSSTTNPNALCTRSNPGLRGVEPATICMNCGTADTTNLLVEVFLVYFSYSRLFLVRNLFSY